MSVSGDGIPAGATQYKLLLEVTDGSGTLIGSPFTDAIPPDSTGLFATFDISGYLDQPDTVTFTYPGTMAVKAYDTRIKSITVKPGERYIDSNGDLQENWGSAATPFGVMRGGVSNRQLATWYPTYTFFAVYIYGKLFLTQRPASDYVHPDQPVKLWFVDTAGGTYIFRLKGYFDDGTTELAGITVTLTALKLYEFDCNPSLYASWFDPAAKKLLSFDCYLESGGVAYSDVRNFTIDWKYCERPFYLLFANSLGGVDDVYLGGFATEGYTTEGNTVLKPPAIDATVYDPTIMIPNRKGSNSFKINTGWKTATQMRHLRDLLVSRQVWLLYPNQGVTSYYVIPVVINNTSTDLVDYQQDLYSCDIEMTEAHKDQFVFDNRLY